MFCSNCGAQMNEGEKFCSNCGAPVEVNSQIKGFTVEDNSGSFSGQNSEQNSSYYTGGGGSGRVMMPLKTDRSYLLCILLSIITCGIYGLIFLYELIKDVNIACEGDGEETPGLLIFILLSMVTCGIYAFIWYYKLGNRLSANLMRYGCPSSDNGMTVLLWMTLGYLLCGLGPFIGVGIIVNNVNDVCAAYNRANGLA